MFDKLLKGMGMSMKIKDEDSDGTTGRIFTFKIVDENLGNASAKDDQLGIKTITVDAFDEALKRVVDARKHKAFSSESMSNIVAFIQAHIYGEELKKVLFTDGETVRINAISFAQELVETIRRCSFNVLKGEFELDTGMLQSALASCSMTIIILSELVPILFNNSSEGGSTND